MTKPTDTTPPRNYSKDAHIYEYGSAANPVMPPVPVLVHAPKLHESGPSRVIPFDLSKHMEIADGPATSPNLMCSFVRVRVGESVHTQANSTSQAFYVIRGSGTSTSAEHGTMEWSTGDMMVLPVTPGEVVHTCKEAEMGGAALYWIHDQPLLDYLGVTPNGVKKFEPTLYKKADILDRVEEIRHDDTRSTNRLGVLLGNAKFASNTKTLTHVLWSLLNSIAPHTVQRPHRHNSTALDLCVAASGNVYTLMGREIDSNGLIIDPIRCDWVPGGCFVTPPGWWHSHHNESGEEAWVLPIQDAGLFTHQRTLDIRFVDDELKLHHEGRIRGSAFVVTNKQFEQIKQLGQQQDSAFTQECEATMACASTEEAEEDSGEEKKEDEERPKRRSSIQVGDLARAGIEKPPLKRQHSFDKSTGKRCKSTQVGADLQALRTVAAAN